MKTLKTTFVIAVLSTALFSSLISCTNDDGDEPSNSNATRVAGTYYGNITSTVMGSESLFENMNVVLTATDEAIISVRISEFGEAPMNMPSISVNGVKVYEADGYYSLVSTEFSGKSETGRLYSGSLHGSYGKGELKVQFTLNYGVMPMPLICSFTGKK